MKRTRLMLAVIGLMALSFPANAGVVLFVLSPMNGIIGGQAGTSVGWGYTVSNTGTDFVTIQSIGFSEAVPIGTFISTPFIPSAAATAGAPIIQTWTLDISGLQYDIFGTQHVPDSTQGLMTLIYDTYDLDPSDPNAVQTGFGDVVNATTLNGSDVIASVTVNQEAAPTTTELPEPGSIGLMGIGCAALGVWRRRRVS